MSRKDAARPSSISSENHSEIERRRRNKVNSYIRDLAEIIPEIVTQKKADKLTILQITYEYIRLLRENGSVAISDIEHSLPHGDTEDLRNISYLTSEEYKQIIMEENMEGRSLLEFIHPDDAEKLNESIRVMEEMESERINQSMLSELSWNGTKPGKNYTDSKMSNLYQLFMTTTTNHNDIHDPTTTTKYDFTLRFRCGNEAVTYFGDPDHNAICKNVQDFCKKQRESETDAQGEQCDYQTIHCFSLLKSADQIRIGDIYKPAMLSQGQSSVVIAFGVTLDRESSSKNSNSALPVYNNNPTSSIQLGVDANIYFVDETLAGVLGASPHKLLVVSSYRSRPNVSVPLKLVFNGNLVSLFANLEAVSNACTGRLESVVLECEDVKPETLHSIIENFLNQQPFTPNSSIGMKPSTTLHPDQFSMLYNQLAHNYPVPYAQNSLNMQTPNTLQFDQTMQLQQPFGFPGHMSTNMWWCKPPQDSTMAPPPFYDQQTLPMNDPFSLYKNSNQIFPPVAAADQFFTNTNNPHIALNMNMSSIMPSQPPLNTNISSNQQNFSSTSSTAEILLNQLLPQQQISAQSELEGWPVPPPTTLLLHQKNPNLANFLNQGNKNISSHNQD